MKLTLLGTVAALLGSTVVAGIGIAHGDTIVNISAEAGGSGVNCCSPDPFNPVTLNLSAGDYAVINAWGDPNALYDAWNPTRGAPVAWNWEWKVFSFDGTNYTQVAEVAAGNYFATRAEARDFALSLPATQLHLAADTTLAFALGDYELRDNAGGVSLRVTEVIDPSPIPEPAANAFIGVGLLSVGTLLVMRRRRSPVQL